MVNVIKIKKPWLVCHGLLRSPFIPCVFLLLIERALNINTTK
nr:MAG TPA: hypothetical protein [Caudoviricetes sp.]